MGENGEKGLMNITTYLGTRWRIRLGAFMCVDVDVDACG